MASSLPAEPKEVIGGNVYPKYTTRNPLARLLVDNFARSLDGLVERTGARQVHEVGCGEGFLSSRLANRGLRVRGSDLSAAAIEEARTRAGEHGLAIPFQVADLYSLSPDTDAAELVICCEVLEHVPDPERALRTLAGLARPWLILSVPREPLWRLLNMARGHYLRSLGNTPGHLQHWSASRFRHLVGCHAEIVESRTPLPWTMLLCRTA
jgi:2-polyprenyl-3-methyl-5-hydroxy-6-metoxy-1,4-benzoquinol methylase